MHRHTAATTDAEEAEQLQLAIALSKAEHDEQRTTGRQSLQQRQQHQQQQQQPAGWRAPQPQQPPRQQLQQPTPPPPRPPPPSAPFGRGAGGGSTPISSGSAGGAFGGLLRSLRDGLASGIAAGAGALGVPRCAGCGRHATGGLVEPLITLGGSGGFGGDGFGGETVYHAGCFRCAGCGQPLAAGGGGGGRFEYVMGPGTPGGGNGPGQQQQQQPQPQQPQQRPYHPHCHRARFDPKCCVCHQLIPRSGGGNRIEWHTHPFWKGLRWCPAHSRDGTPQCCACGRPEPRGAEWPALGDDGRRLCLDCLGTVTLDTADAQPVYKDVQRFFALNGMPLPAAAPPLLLVEGKVLTDYAAREGLSRGDGGGGGSSGGGGDAGGPVFHVRGLCLATVYTSIPSVVRAASAGAAGLLGVSSVAAALRAPQQRCSVQGLLVMYGLPRLLTGSIIAHELTHAWVRMRHVARLDPQLEEGLCQLMAYLWLEAQAHAAAADSPGAERLLSYLAHQIRADPSAVYGDGFRAALAAFQARGVKALFEHALAHRCFPTGWAEL